LHASKVYSFSTKSERSREEDRIRAENGTGPPTSMVRKIFKHFNERRLQKELVGTWREKSVSKAEGGCGVMVRGKLWRTKLGRVLN